MTVYDMSSEAKTNSIVSTLRGRFVATALDKINEIDGFIHGLDADCHLQHIKEIKTIAHSLKGMAGSFGFMSVTRIAEAFEDYLQTSELNGVAQQIDLQHYNDAMRAIIESGDEPDDGELDAIIGTLPAPSCPG